MITDTAPKTEENQIDPKEFGEYAAERKELKEIFDPLANIAAKRIEHAIDESPDQIRERLSEIKVDELPYGNAYLFLPPGLLEGKAYSLEAPEHLEGFDRWDWFYNIVEEYVNEKKKHGTPYEKERYQDFDVDMSHHLVEIPTTSIDRIQEAKRGFDSDRWKKYESAYRRHCEEGTERDFYRLLEVRAGNGDNRYHAPAMYDSFSYIKANLKREHRVIDNIVVPVGAYGKDFADGLGKSALFMIEVLDTAIHDEAQEMAESHQEVLHEFTARGEDTGEDGPDADSTARTIQEGVLSVMQIAALLTSDKVEGYNDPGRLLHDVIEQGLIEKVTRLMPPALIGPTTLRGYRFPHPLEIQSDGSLDFSEGFKEWLHKAHVEHWRAIMRNKEYLREQHPKIGMGLTCPASGKGGGVGTMAHTLDKVYQTVA